MEQDEITEAFDFKAAAALPQNIRFGTSTWTYPGWKGMIYRLSYRDEKDFKANCLKEYAGFPWFRTVGIDSTFYTPPTKPLLRRYAAQVPPDFLWVSKVWERLTIPRYPSHPRYGERAGKDNPDFLNPDLFVKKVLPAYLEPEVRPHAGPFVFQFPTIAAKELSAETFIEGLHAFFGSLPQEFQYAVEVRNPDYLTPAYFQALNARGVTHCFNHWNYMPALKAQMQAAAEAGGLAAPFFVARILTPRHTNYQQAVDRFKPYDRLQAPMPDMRRDVVRLARRAIERNVPAFVVVNNRAEGNAPLTVNALGRMLAAPSAP